MPQLTRRTLLGAMALAGSGLRVTLAAGSKISIGVTDWNLRLAANPEALLLAKRIGFDGIQVSFGRRLVDGKMPLDNPEVIAQYLRLAREHGIPINGTCVDKLHDNGLKSDKLAIGWVLDGIRLTKALRTEVLLLPFFGKWSIDNVEERNAVGDKLREIAPEAEKAGVILGIEDMLSAEDNVRIIDRAKSANVAVYYDVGNSTQSGFDAVKEIRWLGKDRICQIHLKDGSHYLGEGAISFPRVMDALGEIGFAGAANLETDTHEGSTVDADMGKNLAYIRELT